MNVVFIVYILVKFVMLILLLLHAEPGRFLAELTMQVFSDLAASKYQVIFYFLLRMMAFLELWTCDSS